VGAVVAAESEEIAEEHQLIDVELSAAFVLDPIEAMKPGALSSSEITPNNVLPAEPWRRRHF
jgi:hypothetical protein